MSEDHREMIAQEPGGPPVIAPGHTFATVTDKISAIVLTRKTPTYWLIPFAVASARRAAIDTPRNRNWTSSQRTSGAWVS